MASSQKRLHRYFVPGRQDTGNPVKYVKSRVGGQRIGFKQKMLRSASRVVLGNGDRGPCSVGIGYPKGPQNRRICVRNGVQIGLGGSVRDKVFS